jgi:PST family polysaccharide transporter
MAYRGHGVWALVAQQLVTVTLNTALLMRVSPGRLKGRPDIPSIKRVLTYGKSITGFSLVNFCIRNGDNFLIGRYAGTEALGAYSLAYKLMMVPLQTVASIACRISFPELSRLQERGEPLKERYLVLTRQIAILAFPIMAALAIYSDFLIATFFGTKWDNTPGLLAILAGAGLVQTAIFPVGQLYLIRGRPGLMFKVTAVMGVITVLAFVAGIPWGALGVAVAYVLVTVVTAPFEIHYPGALIGVGVVDVLKAVRVPAANTGIAALFGIAITYAMRTEVRALAFAASFAVFVSIYVLLAWMSLPSIGRGILGRRRRTE